MFYYFQVIPNNEYKSDQCNIIQPLASALVVVDHNYDPTERVQKTIVMHLIVNSNVFDIYLLQLTITAACMYFLANCD